MKVTLVAIVVAPLITLTGDRADACAPAPPKGAHVDIAGEEALIIYDPRTQMETFVRRAVFESAAQEFGFLVPTPDKPELGEAPNHLFSTLERTIEPEVRYETKGMKIEPMVILLMTLGRSSAPQTPLRSAPPVRVLEEKRVAGYDATVLEADDPQALAEWLGKHGYDSRPELVEWLTPYVAMKWKLTAFKIARDEGGGSAPIATSAVRMRFRSERPFYPYREPADQRTNTQLARKLRVFLVTEGRVDGTIGVEQPKAWAGKLEYAAPFDFVAAGFDRALDPAHWPQNPWLVAYVDASSPRPGTDDLFFAAAADKSELRPQPIIVTEPRTIPIPLDLIVVVGLIGFVVRRIKKRS